MSALFTEPGIASDGPTFVPRSVLGLLLTICLLLGVASGCSSDEKSTTDAGKATTSTAAAEGSVLRVPEDHKSIQAAVDAAKPGDMVLVGEGIYNEAVDVTTEDITIRGVDRNKVILDGEFELENGIRVLDTEGVVVENMTARNYVSNGFFWTGSDRFKASYLTVYRTGEYGIYAFNSYHGLIEHSHGSGSVESPLYIGECFPCDIVVNDMVSEYSGVGYSGTNSGGDLFIINSVFRNNRVGMLPNSGSYELCYPGRQTTIVGNTIHDNNLLNGPGYPTAFLAQGNGVVLAGSVDSRVERNRIFNHARTGISLVPWTEPDGFDSPPPASEHDRPCRESRKDPLPPEPVGLVLWDVTGNRIIGNHISGSGIVDLASGYITDPVPGVAVAGAGNCFSGNVISSSAPPGLQEISPCDGPGNGGDQEEGTLNFGKLYADRPPEPSRDAYRSTPVPADQENMPRAATAPHPRFEAPERVDVDAIAAPEMPSA